MDTISSVLCRQSAQKSPPLVQVDSNRSLLVSSEDSHELERNISLYNMNTRTLAINSNAKLIHETANSSTSNLGHIQLVAENSNTRSTISLNSKFNINSPAPTNTSERRINNCLGAKKFGSASCPSRFSEIEIRRLVAESVQDAMRQYDILVIFRKYIRKCNLSNRCVD